MNGVTFGNLESSRPTQFVEEDVIDPTRIAVTVHYIISEAEAGKLGHVKLNRILWYADLEYYRWHGISITGLRQYTRTSMGPMYRDISRAVRWLAREGKVIERTVRADCVRREMVSIAPPDVSFFTDEQIAILTQATKVIAPLTAIQIWKMNSDDRLLQQVKNGEVMPVATAALMTPPLASMEPRQAA